MNDLVARATKYAQGAGRTQEGQYLGAKRDEHRSTWIGWTSAALSATVGTSIFAQWVQRHPTIFGMAAILAATLAAVQRTAKFAERADAHRSSGAEYGRLRRRIDMLRLRIEGGDITREDALSQLDRIGEKLSDLARQARVLPGGIYERAKREFDKNHQEYVDP
jgi:hypothetical protein